MIPGCDLLDIASQMIALQDVNYYKALSRAANDVGQYVTAYYDPVIINGSMQPIAKNLYDSYGLDLQKTYFNFYTSNDLIDLQRNVSEDQIQLDSDKYQCESATNWFKFDGWKAVLCSLIVN